MIKLNGFSKMMDQDYPFPLEKVIIFNPSDEYLVKGKTHGMVSHGIKHLIEWEPSFVKNILLSMKSKLNIDSCFILTKQKLIKPLTKNDLNDEVLLNTLDLVNDKIENFEKLSIEEQQIQNIIREIQSKYRYWCSYLEGLAVEILDFDDKMQIRDKINKTKVIYFNVSYMDVDMINLIDFRKGLYMSVHKNMVRTLFKMSGTFLGRQYRSKAKVKNKFLEKLLLELFK